MGLHRWLDSLFNGGDLDAVMFNGKCRSGFDTYAEDWAVSRGIPVEPFYAKWNLYGNAAGPLRNQLMVDTALAHGGHPVLVAAPIKELPCKGTRGTIKYAEEKGLDTVVYEFGYLEGWDPAVEYLSVDANKMVEINGAVARWKVREGETC